jgi:hypothetical protein
MAKKYTYNSDPLDELLEKLNSGDFVDQSMHEFSNTVKGYSDSKRKRGTTNSYTRSTYSTVRPRIKSDVEVASFSSRYDQIIASLSNIVYDNYAAGKKDGYEEAIKRYLEMTQQYKNNLLHVEQQVASDLETIQKKMNTITIDGYTQGYYDALTMVKKVLHNSKLARLRELSNNLK